MPPTDPSDITVRAANVEDRPALEAFIAPFVEQKKLLPRTPEELDELMPSGFLALSGERIVGFAALEIYSKKLAEIRSLAVLPEYRGRGIGRRLVESCIDLAHRRHILEVMVVTSSEDFFKSCGFDFTLPGEKKALFLQTRET